ncbi:T9SS type A sorting domain-containing protein [Emticicia sp. CRIBPO]|uniref:T9SS type A sorting domain-containing protein n=1 Tax=Emticicia sp. CRIBPO TaxID=2683258 RepID=UPI00141247AF|nr:T9SS type A sorting domain-containing protein [Emticicia sp. CRIBPO]NBA84719.1 T9SS type A sorting domain-containing protein [Emticicia sp. CRIBPO]
MKKILVIIFMHTAFFTFGQDPNVTASGLTGTVVPTNTPFFNGETVSFSVEAGTSVGSLNWPAPGGTPFEVEIVTTRIYDPQIVVTGLPANYFTYSINQVSTTNPLTYQITIIQNQAIPEGSYTRFTITGVVSGFNGQSIGYQVNGSAGGYLSTNTGTDSPSSYGDVDGTLPVSLIDFTAKAEGQVAHLKWSTSEESNSDHFQVQHSLDAKNWVTKGIVSSSGESKTVKHYSFSDAEVANGHNYYRLKSVDKDGSFTISKSRSVFFEDIPEVNFEVFPNPATDRFTIKTPDWNKVKAVSIVNLNGREVYRSGSKPNPEISVGNLPYGIYTVKIIYANQSAVVKRLAIQK